MTNTGTATTANALAEKVYRLKTAILSPNRRNEYNARLSSRDPARGFGKRELYPLGFKMASDILIERLPQDKDSPDFNDALVYPIFYGYRHYIELRLKNQIWRLSGFPKQDPKSPRRRDGHELLTLWTSLRQLLENQHMPEDEPLNEHQQTRQHKNCENYDEIEAYIQVLHELDAGSLSFRYADADFPVPDEDTELAVINLEELKSQVAKLSNEMDRIGLN